MTVLFIVDSVCFLVFRISEENHEIPLEHFLIELFTSTQAFFVVVRLDRSLLSFPALKE